VPEKTVWWLVSFKWCGSEWQYAGIQDSPGEIYVNDILNQRKAIKRLELDQAYETLGVFLAPDGNLEVQFDKMYTVITWVDGLQTGKISRVEAWLALQSTILRTLYYPLPALRLSKAQCEAIYAPLLQHCLPSLGMCRNFPKKLVYSTFDFMGLNFLHLFMLQEITRLKDIVFHTFSGTLTGFLYTSSLELLLFELGCTVDFKWDPTLINILATDSLIKATWCFLYHNNITLIHDVKLYIPRVHDLFIIEALIVLKVSSQELRICNHCRMYLHAIFLSNITTGDGMAILESAWNGTPINFPSNLDPGLLTVGLLANIGKSGENGLELPFLEEDKD
jgi:mRNA-degrading endonuclease HigB of HigAB toxin-antitoxin module